MSRSFSRGWWWLVAVAVLAAALFAAWQVALRQFQQAVLASLGPRASVGAWQVGLNGVVLTDVRILADRSGPLAWPAEDELRAARVRLQPTWRSLWAAEADGWQLQRVHIEGAYLSVLRPRRGGLRLLPSLLERPALRSGAAPSSGEERVIRVVAQADRPAEAPSGAPPRKVMVHEVIVENAALDVFDASVGRPPHRVQLAALNATLGPIAWPALDQPVPVTLDGRLKGLPSAGDSRDGQLHIDGTLTPSTREARLAVRLRGVDLRVLQPYLLRVNEGGVERGFVDLDLDATVRAQRLHAPGRVVFSGLQLAARPGVFGSFAGLPQQLVLAAVRERGRIELKFTLEGRLDDPAFSLDENLATRIGVGLAQSLGVSVGGVVEGLGSVIKGLFGR